MLYVGIDQHKRHLTIGVRDDQGEVVLRRQVKTRWLEVDRFLESLRHRLGRQLTRVKNGIKGILRRHNPEQACPTKGMWTRTALRWLKGVPLPAMDRIELNIRLEQYGLYALQIEHVEALIHQRARRQKTVALLRTLPKIGEYTALALLAHIGPIDRFRSARSLANFFGITPGCRNSGGSDRPGSITKAGHPFIRFLLGQMVLHALRNDPGLRQWYRGIKRRRGSKIARVAVMRRLCGALWHMLTEQAPYRPAGSRSLPQVGRAFEAALDRAVTGQAGLVWTRRLDRPAAAGRLASTGWKTAKDPDRNSWRNGRDIENAEWDRFPRPQAQGGDVNTGGPSSKKPQVTRLDAGERAVPCGFGSSLGESPDVCLIGVAGVGESRKTIIRGGPLVALARRNIAAGVTRRYVWGAHGVGSAPGPGGEITV